MHIHSTPHESGTSGQVFHYEADYAVLDQAIRWSARVSHAEALHCTLDGEIPFPSPALTMLAEQVVRDEIVKRIDGLEDRQPGADDKG